MKSTKEMVDFIMALAKPGACVRIPEGATGREITVAFDVAMDHRWWRNQMRYDLQADGIYEL